MNAGEKETICSVLTAEQQIVWIKENCGNIAD